MPIGTKRISRSESNLSCRAPAPSSGRSPGATRSSDHPRCDLERAWAHAGALPRAPHERPGSADPRPQAAAEPGARARTKARGGKGPGTGERSVTSPGARSARSSACSASACCSLAAAWGTRVRTNGAGLVPQPLPPPRIPRRAAHRAPRVPSAASVRPPGSECAGFRRGGGSGGGGAATPLSRRGRRPRPDAPLAPGPRLTQAQAAQRPPVSARRGGDTRGRALTLHLGLCEIGGGVLQTRNAEADSWKGLGANSGTENSPSPYYLLS